MKINSALSFKGKFYTMSDAHARAPMTAGLLSEIENRNKDKKEPIFILDGGDFMGDNYPVDATSKLYTKFKEKNPNANLIFNLGNVELEGWYISNYPFLSECPNIFKNFDKKGIKVVNATIYKLSEENDEVRDYIKPYAVVNDVVDGKNSKVLITGFTQRRMNLEKDKEETKELLRTIIKPAIDKEKPDSVILMMHTMKNYTDDILDYAINDLKIDNIKLVAGGHPHSIEDYTYGKARVLYPAPNGKACYEINHTKNGYDFDKICMNKNHYDYSPLLKVRSVIANLNIDKPLPVNEAYKSILATATSMNEVVAISPYTFLTRNENISEVSEPSELGTFMADSIKTASNTDIGIMLTMDFRERLPQKDKNITVYNINDVINVDKLVYKLEDVSVTDLKNIFEISLKKQDMGQSNSDFFEVSSNVKIERRIDESENKVVQIYIKENEEWQKLLNEDGSSIDDSKTFTIGTCSYIALGGRESLNYFKTLKSAPVGDITTRQMVINSLRELGKNPPEKYETAQLITV